MHFEILIEDQSGKKCLGIIVPKFISGRDTFNVISYKGIGRIPKNLNENSDSSKRILLAQLPKLLKGYGNAFAKYPENYRAAVILVCDLDDKSLRTFLGELNAILDSCSPKPITRFCIAIEEGEAWLLGDVKAIKSAYPNAKESILNSYVNDSICGTWETLANAVYKGGAHALSAEGWQRIGAEKSNWSEKISPYMDVYNNCSPSFCHFRNTITGPYE